MTKTHRNGVAATAVRRPEPLPRWLTVGSLLLALVGLAASAYLTWEHFTASATLACPEGQVVNCQKVTESDYATFLGMPVALLGLLYFVALLVLCLPGAWRNRRLDAPRFALLGLGTVMVIYLVWAELFRIGAICLWCTVIHVVTVALLGLALVAWAIRPRT